MFVGLERAVVRNVLGSEGFGSGHHFRVESWIAVCDI